MITNAFQACSEQSDRSSADQIVSTSSSKPSTSAVHDYHPLVSITTQRLLTAEANAKEVNDSVTITISDTGSGIPDAIKEKIFQPFFATKPTGEGTGLGLSLSYDIVKAHGGEVKADSRRPKPMPSDESEEV